jgi:hypothetical protein
MFLILSSGIVLGIKEALGSQESGVRSQNAEGDPDLIKTGFPPAF